MSSGSWSSTVDTYNRATRTWSGNDDPLHKESWNPYYGRHEFFSSSGFDHWITNYPSAGWHLGPRAYHSGFNPSLGATLYNWHVANQATSNTLLEAWNKTVSQIQGSDFNLGVQLGTFGDTLDSVLSLSRGVLESYRSIRRRDIPGAFRSLSRGLAGAAGKMPSRKLESRRGRTQHRVAKGASDFNFSDTSVKSLHSRDVSSMWLSLRYGWQPMLQDIHECMKYLDRNISDQALIFTNSASSKLKTARGGVGSYSPWIPPSFSRFTGAYVIRLTRRPSVIDQLGLADPSQIAWEVIPFSFVVDWFVPVGDYLKARSIVPLLDTQCGRSQHWVIEVAQSGYNPYDADPWAGGGDVYLNGRCRDRIIDFRRDLVSATPPKPELKAIKRALSLGHLENGAALIHQLVSSAHG